MKFIEDAFQRKLVVRKPKMDDPSTWDVPDVMKERAPAAGALTPTAKRTPIQPRRRTPVPDLDQEDHSAEKDRLELVANHRLVSTIPADVAVAMAEGRTPPHEIGRSIATIGRSLDLPVNLFFTPWTAPGGRQAYLNPEGKVISAHRAKALVQEDAPRVIRGMLRSAVDNNNNIALSTPATRRRTQVHQVAVDQVASVAEGIVNGLDDATLQSMDIAELLGTATQVAASMRKREIKTFTQNLALVKDHGLPMWQMAVGAALSSAQGGRRYANFEDFAENEGFDKMSSIQMTAIIRQGSIKQNGIRVYRGDRYWWNPGTNDWEVIPLPPGQEAPTGGQGDINYFESDTPPSSWEDGAAPTDPTPYGGANIGDGGSLKEVKVQLQAAGLKWSIDTSKPDDWYAESRKLAHDMELEELGVKESALVMYGDAVMEKLNDGFEWVQGKLVERFADFTYGPAALAGGSDQATQYKNDMYQIADDIYDGRTTMGMKVAELHHLPAWQGAVIDVFLSLAADPLIVAPKFLSTINNLRRLDVALFGLRESQAGRLIGALGTEARMTPSIIARAGAALGEDSRVGRLLARLGTEVGDPSILYRFGQYIDTPTGIKLVQKLEQVNPKAAEKLLSAGRKIDEAVGLPVSGFYRSQGAKMQWFLEHSLRAERRQLGGKSLVGWLVDEASSTAKRGTVLYDRVNEYFRTYYHGEAFPPETARAVQTIVDIGEQGGASRDELVDLVEQFMLSQFGTRPLNKGALETLIYEPSRVLGGQPTPKRGFLKVQELEQEAMGLERGVPGDPGEAIGDAYGLQPEARVKYIVNQMDDTDARVAQAMIDEVAAQAEHTSGIRRQLFEVPRYSRMRRVATAFRNSEFANTELGRFLDAALNKVPEATVHFEEGRYVSNVQRRLRRARVFTQERQAELMNRARTLAETTNPNREHDMVGFLEQLTKETWERVAESYRLAPDLHRPLFEILRGESDKVNFKMAKEAYGVKMQRTADGVLEYEVIRRPMGETQLLNSWYIPDPLAMRRAVREQLGLAASTSDFARRTFRDMVILRAHEPSNLELVSSRERNIFAQQLDDALDRANWSRSHRDWAMKFWDQLATHALVNRPDEFKTYDDFFRQVGIEFSRNPAEIEGALFKRLADVDPDLPNMVERARVYLAANPGATAWYDVSAQAIRDLGPKYLFGTTTLNDGTEIADVDLFAQILAVMSPQKPVAENIKQAIVALGSLKSGNAIVPGLPSIRASLEDILSGSRRVEDLAAPVRDRLVRAEMEAQGYRGGVKIIATLGKPPSDLKLGQWVTGPELSPMGMPLAGQRGLEVGRVESVALDQVEDTQAALRMRANDVENYTALPKETLPPIVLERTPDGRLAIRDGHHRTYAARARGEQRIKAIVIDIDETGEPIRWWSTRDALNKRVTTTMDGWEGLYVGDNMPTSAQRRIKVFNFYKNLIGEQDRVTVDLWMARLFGYSDAPSKSEYADIAMKVRKIAADLGITPAQAQAGLWGLVKTEYADMYSEFATSLRKAAELSPSKRARALKAISKHPEYARVFEGYGRTTAELSKLPSVGLLGDDVDPLEWARYFEKQISRMRDARNFDDFLRLDVNIENLQKVADLSKNGPTELSVRMGDWLNKVKDGEIQGMFLQPETGRSVVRFFETSDLNTFVHESGHFLRSVLGDEDIAALERHLEVDFSTPDVNARRFAEERFADSLEMYFENKIAQPGVLPIYERIRDLFGRLWRGPMRGEKVDPTLRKIFDRWFDLDALPETEVMRHANELGTNLAAKYAKSLTHQLAYDVYLKFWKPAMVMRPGYILRVPGLDEQIRFLTDMGGWSRLTGQGVIAKSATRLANRGLLPKGWVEETVKIPTESGEVVEYKRIIPGAMLDEAYANSGTSATQVYQGFREQAEAVVKGAGRNHWGPVEPTSSRYGGTNGAWSTAVNGHIASSIPGRYALAGIAGGMDRDAIVADLARYMREDEVGKRVAARMGIADEIDDWAEEYVGIVGRSTLWDRGISAAALRRQATPEMMDRIIEPYRAAARRYLAAQKVFTPRELRGLEGTVLEHNLDGLRNSVRANGGATWDPTTGKFYEAQRGYIVSMNEETVVRRGEAVLENRAEFNKAIQELVRKKGDLLRDNKGSYIGIWVDGGEVHFDVSEVVDDYNVAMGLAIERKQIAFADAGNDFANVYTIDKPVVHGQLVEHMSGVKEAPLQAVFDTVGKAILQYPTNHLSRQPFFKSWYDRMMKLQLEMAKDAGILPADARAAERMIGSFEANARRFALDRVNKVMFNLKDQNRLAEALGFVAPFMQPYFEAFSVYGHLLRAKPQLAGYAVLAFREAKQAGFIKYEDGEWRVPMSNFLFLAPAMRMMSHWPGMELSAPLSAFNMFFGNSFPVKLPGVGSIGLPSPGLSPPMTWFLQQFKGNDGSRYATWLYQYGPVGWKNFVPLPTWMQNSITSLNPNFNEQGYTAYTEDFMRLAQHEGLEFDSRQELIEWAESQAKVFYRYKAVISAFFPAAPTIEFATKPLEDEYRALQEKYEGDPGKATEVFLDRHPDQWLVVTPKTMWERKDPGLPGDFYAPSVPATATADRILARPGFREFAEQFPAMAWAILPQEAFNSDEYDPDVFQKQLAVSDRRYLTPEEFAERGESTAGWEAYWHLREWYDSAQETLKANNVSETNPEWEHYKNQYNEQLESIRELYPAFGDQFGDTTEQKIDPRVLSYARELTRNEVFMDFPIGKGLGEYMAMRDGIQREMREKGISSIDSEAAIQTGLSGRYETAVNDIIKRYPDFERAFNIFFEGSDLVSVRSEADKAISALPEAEREAAFEWQRTQNDLLDQLSAAPNDRARAPIYKQLSDHAQSAYTDFPPEANPAKLWYEGQDYLSRAEYANRTVLKSFSYLTPFERQEILGLTSNEETSAIWAQINQSRTQISQLGDTKSGYSSSAGYDALNRWVRQKMAVNQEFATQVGYANTWGWAFFNKHPYMQQEGLVGDSWRNFQTTVTNYQDAADRADLHSGTGYNNLRQQLVNYVAQVKAASPAFARQWDNLEAVSDSDLIDTFMPPVYFPLGGRG